MKLKTLFLLALGLVASRLPAAPLGTAFTYQGYLSGAGAAATGNFDLQFSLFDAANNGNQVGPTLTNLDVGVNNGLFLVTLDFGNVFNGDPRWLALGVRTNGNATAEFTALTPLQPLTPTPYALYSTNAGAAGNVTSNSVSVAQLSTPGGSPAPGEVLGYNGTNLVWTNGSGGPGGGWSLTGNAGTTAGTDFVGTTDVRPLELHVSGVRGWQLAPTFDTPNLIGGAPGNYVPSAVQGATIGGGGTITTYGRAYSNSIFAFHGTIGGGLGNTIQANAIESTIAGGNQNSVQSAASDSSIGGGFMNTIQTGATYSTVAGGNQNSIQSGAYDSTVAGGAGNTIQIDAYYSDIAGGQANTIQTNTWYSAIAGGFFNTIASGASYSAIAGGGFNTIAASAPYSIIGGGQTNTIQNNAANSFIGGGDQNTIQDSASYSSIPGGSENTIEANAVFSSIGGGAENSIQVGSDFGAIGGGFQNTIQSAAHNTTIGGGNSNTITAGASGAFIGGGQDNSIDNSWYVSPNASICGGIENYISSANCAIGGGLWNSILGVASNSVIAGGCSNIVFAQGAVVGGGTLNGIYGEGSTLGGGYGNTVTGAFSAIGGGYQNNITGAANYSTIPGGQYNIANASYCFAAGNQAQAQNQGCFVWADSQPMALASTANDQFCVRARGGVQLDPTTSISFGSQTRQMLNLWGNAYGIGVQNDREYFRAGDTNAGFSWFLGGAHNDSADNPGSGGVEVMNLTYGLAGIGPGNPGFAYEAGLLHVMGQLNVDANAYASDFYSTSDRNKKENFGPVDTRTILDKVSALPITTWNFKGRRERHLGPMAQDFRAAFDLSPDDKHISVLDEAGVALAAIQGMNQKWDERGQKLEAAMQEKDAKIARLEKELAEVKSAQSQTVAEWETRFEALRKDVARVADKSEGGLAAASPTVGLK